MRKLLFVFSLTILTACAPKMQWTKSGATVADYNKDSYECEKDTRQSGYFGGGLSGERNMGEFFSRCMTAHGWGLQPQGHSGIAEENQQLRTNNYQAALKNAEAKCHKLLPKKKMGDAVYNQCIASNTP